jgi:hypothetical protein
MYKQYLSMIEKFTPLRSPHNKSLKLPYYSSEEL